MNEGPRSIIGWLIAHKILTNEPATNITLIGVGIVAATLAVIIFAWSNGSATPQLTPQESNAQQHLPGSAPLIQTPSSKTI